MRSVADGLANEFDEDPAPVAGLAYGRRIRRVVADMRVALFAAACWVLSCGLVHADAAAPRRPGDPVPGRGSFQRPAIMTVTPAGAAPAPDRVIVYLSREHLQALLGQVEGSPSGEGDEPGASSTLRHVVAAVALAIALLSLPLLLGRKRTWPATAALLLAGAGATAWVAAPVAGADIAAPGIRRTPPGPPPSTTPNTQARVTATLEIRVRPSTVQPAVQLVYGKP